jgi:hypothetical protein
VNAPVTEAKIRLRQQAALDARGEFQIAFKGTLLFIT